jgi:glycosyltransferase involved in cell wall biosynthesis
VSPADQPFCTIITVCYNAVDDLPATIASVLAQSSPDYEYLVIDGGSSDGTLQLLEREDARLRFISEPDRGIYDACNKGLALARGRYVNILMAGDTHAPDFLGVHRGLLRDGAAFSYGGVIAVRPDGREIANIPRDIQRAEDVIGMPFAHPSLVVRTDLARELGGFDQRYRYAADLDFICRLLAGGYRGINARQALSRYSMGGVGNSYRSLRESWEILRRTRGISPAVVKVALKQLIYTFLIRNGWL